MKTQKKKPKNLQKREIFHIFAENKKKERWQRKYKFISNFS